MSWSFTAVGKPEAVKRAIEASSNNKCTGNSLNELNEAKPALYVRLSNDPFEELV